VRAYKPPPQAAEWWSRRCEKNLVVNLDFLASPVIRHRIFQAQPALPRLAHAGFEFHLDLVAVEIEPHFAGETSEGANPSPLHHVINVEPQGALYRSSSAVSSAAKSAHLADSICSN
jgi:hypothetical protein